VKKVLSGRERRVHRRISREQLSIKAEVRIPSRPPISLVDLSSGGALIDLPFQIRPDSQVKLELVTRSDRLTLPVRLLRCYVVSLKDGVRYQAAGEFREELHLPELLGRDGDASRGNRLASTLEAFLRQGATGGGSQPLVEFNHMLGSVLEGVRRGDGPEELSSHIRSHIRQLIPMLSIGPAKGAYLADPSRGARFFDLDFRSARVLTAVDRRMLRAAAQLLSIIDGQEGAATPPSGPTPVEAQPAAPAIAYSIADWQQMCRAAEPMLVCA
jgi:hypothetical protein